MFSVFFFRNKRTKGVKKKVRFNPTFQTPHPVQRRRLIHFGIKMKGELCRGGLRGKYFLKSHQNLPIPGIRALWKRNPILMHSAWSRREVCPPLSQILNRQSGADPPLEMPLLTFWIVKVKKYLNIYLFLLYCPCNKKT